MTARCVDLGPLTELYVLGDRHARGGLDTPSFLAAKTRILRNVRSWASGRLSPAGVRFHLKALHASSILTAEEYARAALHPS